MSGASFDAALAGGGQAGRLIGEIDWSATPVGPIEDWPQSLKTALSIVLPSGYPMYVAWGREFTQFYNDAYRPILGETKHPAAMGQSAIEGFAEIWDIIGPMFGRVMAEGATESHKDFMLPLDRFGYLEECYFDFSYSPVRDETGDVGGVFVTCSETTARVLGERRLRTLRELGSGGSSGATMVDVAGTALEVLARNPHDLPFVLLYLVGGDGTVSLAGSAGVGDHPVPPDDWPLAEVLAGGVPVQTNVDGELASAVRAPWPEPVTQALVLPLLQAATETDPVGGFLVCGISPRRDLNPEYRGFLELVAGQIGAAMTSAGAYQAALDRADALAEIDQAKTIFFSNLSHEFRTPLTLTLGPLEDLLARPDAPLAGPDRERVEMAYRSSSRLLRMVNSLLDFSRLEAGRIQGGFVATDLAALTAGVASAFRSAVEKAGLTLAIDCPPLPEPVWVDQDMWEKVVLNLLSNAFKHTFEGTISVSARPGRGRVLVEVADTGVGIPAEELDRIFDRFHRVHASRSRTHEGSGIGLALVKQLVELHGGEISVRSTPGAGTTFTVSVPTGSAHLPAGNLGGAAGGVLLSNAPGFVEEALQWLPGEGSRQPLEGLGEQVGASTPGSLPDTTAGARILLVDDNRDMRDYVSGLLGKSFSVRAVANGRQAMEAVAEELPDLILTDVMMPEMDGLELVRRLRQNPRTAALPVVMLSALTGEDASIQGLDAGADDYLTKPFSARALVARVRSNLQMARARSAAAQSARLYEGARAAQRRALTILDRVARHLETTSELPLLFGALTRTVAELVEAERAVFWLLDPVAGRLAAQPDAHGFTPAAVAAMRNLPCAPGGTGLAEQIVFEGRSLRISSFGDENVAPYRQVLAEMDVTNAAATAWRAGEEPLGILGAYDSRRPDGFTEEDVWVLDVAALAAGLVWRFKMAERSLVELRESESNQLRREVDRVTHLEELKSEFLRLASHELRGPIAIVRGYVDLLKSGNLGEVSPTQAEIYAVLESKSDEINRLVDQMLETARLEENRLVLDFEVLDLGAVVAEALASIAVTTTGAHSIHWSAPPGPLPVRGDRHRLVTVVRNLLENAIKYSPDGGDIGVECHARNGVAALSVTDHGIGIDETDLPRLFTRFGRIVNRDNSHIPGTGLGLYVSREVARRHGGDIELTSRRGAGTRVVLKMPLHEADVPDAASTLADPAGTTA